MRTQSGTLVFIALSIGLLFILPLTPMRAGGAAEKRGIGTAPHPNSAISPVTNFVVTNLNDNGPGSLRDAINQANMTAGDDVVDFQSGLNGTITLTSGELNIADGLTINGPGVAVINVSGNRASRVFEIANGVSATISGLTISNGLGNGGGISNSGSLMAFNVVLSHNFAAGSNGGGIFNVAMLRVIDCTLSGNAALDGGGIFNQGTCIVENTTFSENGAGGGGGGGGIYNNGGVVTITNSTLARNGGDGGGVRNHAGTVNISFCTIAENVGDGGGAFFNESGATLNIKNSILAKNTGIPDLTGCASQGTGVSFTGKTFVTSDCARPGTTIVTLAQLNLSSLRDNGGPTQTYALLPGSVAIDSVTDCTDIDLNPISADQRGSGRPLDGNGDGVSLCDAGASESPAVGLFDLCIQDDSNGFRMKISSSTGDYLFTNCSSLSIGGKGILSVRGSILTFQHFAADRKVLANIDLSVKKATASVQVFGQGSFTIIDRNTGNSSCNCSAF